MCGFLHKTGELRHAEVLLVEGLVDFLHDLLESIGAHNVAVTFHARYGFLHELPRIPARRFVIARLGQSGEGVVRVILVAVHDEQVARRFTDADTDDVFAVLLELDDHAREIGVAGEQHEGPDLRAREDQLHGVDRETDIRCVLLGRPVGGREDQIDRRFREGHDVLRIATPVGVGATNRDLALDDVRREEVVQLSLQVGANPHRDVVEVDEERGVRCLVHGGTGASGWSGSSLGAAMERSDGSRWSRTLLT